MIGRKSDARDRKESTSFASRLQNDSFCGELNIAELTICTPNYTEVRYVTNLQIFISTNFRLFVLSFPSHSRIFHSFGAVTIAGEGLQTMLGTYGYRAVRVL